MLPSSPLINQQDDMKERILDLLIDNFLVDCSVDYHSDEYRPGDPKIRVSFTVVKPAKQYGRPSPIGNA